MLYIKNMILVRSVNVKIGNPATPLEPDTAYLLESWNRSQV